MERFDVVLVGAGIAGAATAWALARRGVRSVLLVEREEAGDRHSTGRNAAILRTAIPDPALHALARESLAHHLTPPAGFADAPLVQGCGLVLGASEQAAEALLAWTRRADCSVGGEEVSPDEVRERVPALGPRLAAAVRYPREGTIDVHALHQGFLRGALAAGHFLWTRTEARALLLEGGRVVGLHTARGDVACGTVALCGGAWAGELARRADLDLPLEPRRRHLAKTARLTQVDPAGPVVWVQGPEFYLRPESGGLLLCGCEQTPVVPADSEWTDPAALEGLAERTALWAPELADAPIESWWAGARTFAPDNRFVIGRDPRAEGLAWVAALGGHGITTAPAVGALAAEWIVEGSSAHPSAAALAPARLL
jgi:D-arginine dehydrogenase